MIQALTSTHLNVQSPVGPFTLSQRGYAMVSLVWGAGPPPTARGGYSGNDDLATKQTLLELESAAGISLAAQTA